MVIPALPLVERGVTGHVLKQILQCLSTEVGLFVHFEQNRELFEPGAARGRALMSWNAWQARLSYLPHMVIGGGLFLSAARLQRWSAHARGGGIGAGQHCCQPVDADSLDGDSE